MVCILCMQDSNDARELEKIIMGTTIQHNMLHMPLKAHKVLRLYRYIMQ